MKVYKLKVGDLVVLKAHPNELGVGIILNIIPQTLSAILYRVLFADSIFDCWAEDIGKVTYESR
jgi:hypothetical protein